MVEIGDGIGEADEAYDAREIAVDGHVHAGIQDEPRRWGVRHSAEDDHRCGSVCICPAESCEFSRPAPFPLEGMRVGKRGEVIPVVSTDTWPAHELDTFVQINMVLAEILAQQELDGMAGCSGAQVVRCGGQRGGVQDREGGARTFLGKYFEFETSAGIAEAGDTIVAFEWIVGEAQLEILEEAEFQQSVHVLMAVGGFESVFDFQYAALHGLRGGRKGGAIRHGYKFVLR